MAATKRIEQKAATRAKIMAGASVLFAQQGYEAVTMRDLAKHCEVSTGAVFANFTDKADLFQAATGRPAPPERLRKFLEGVVHGVLQEDARTLLVDLYGAGA
jgi:AcrR family transcriptional regulator